MATVVLSAIGAAAGASFGGGMLGLSSVVIGRAVGAVAGRMIDQRLLGAGSQSVETGRVERFRLSGASEGSAIGRVYGRMRIAGQVIWASQFEEMVSTSGGGKGVGKRTSTTNYSYSVSLAIGLGDGVISRIGRVWADGAEIPRDQLNFRFYSGSEDQLPDAKIEAVEGAGQAPAYRGTAYVVIEGLDLTPFGNRVPQFTFEVMRPAQDGAVTDLTHGVQGVAMVPGTGEYALATTPVTIDHGPGLMRSANVNSPSGKSDFSTSLEMLTEELPNCNSVSLVVSWFGDDLRCGSCTLQPKVEQAALDGDEMPWSVSGLVRSSAAIVAQEDERPIYGGTPTDRSVIEAIQAIQEQGGKVVFYPFILMDQMAGNGLPDPWSDAGDQAGLPWRGRITLSKAPGQPGSPDQTVTADQEVAAFFGTAAVGDFVQTEDGVGYSGPQEWSYRRFILHYAHLCAAAGNVDAFCIGSEMRGLTQVRGSSGFVAVQAMRELAADVRSILPNAKIGYAADWSEYFGHQPQDGTGDVYFHLDPLWSDANIDFIGIDNYVPLSDWRDGDAHLDAEWGSIYNVEYLKSNILGGEGYDWYYHAPEAEEVQLRSPIEDGAHGEPWVYRYKDIRNWWQNPHHERIGGVRQSSSTGWVPESKPVWFTELGCAALDKATNQPNKFLDPKSSESRLPKHSNGKRDDLIQMQYLRAMFEFWNDGANNPVSIEYGQPMVDMTRAHVWAWDARPYPFFPANSQLWSDGENYARGHWINGRTSSRSLADVVAEICTASGVTSYDVSELHGLVRGYCDAQPNDARSALQPLMLAYGFEAVERNGTLVFKSRTGRRDHALTRDDLAISSELNAVLEATRAPEAEVAGRLRLSFVDADTDYDVRAEEAVFPDDAIQTVSHSEIPLTLTRAEGRAIVERWHAEARVARDTLKFALPLSKLKARAGDVVSLDTDDGAGLFRIDHVTLGDAQIVEAVRVEPGVYQPSDATEEPTKLRPFSTPVPVFSLFMDLPLLRGDEVEHAPHIAVAANPWPGSAALFASIDDSGYELNRLVTANSTIGVTQTPLFAASPASWDRGAPLRVKLSTGKFSSASVQQVLNGANIIAIGDGSAENWEIFQFADAAMVAPDTYELSRRLRGQAGSDALIPAEWPAGSIVVLLDAAPEQIELPLASRGLARHYRIGPAQRGVDDPSFRHSQHAFSGIGLRPLSPVHLRGAKMPTGGFEFSWIRRTRIDGDSWQSVEVPLGEAQESYVVRVVVNGEIVRELNTSTPAWKYETSQMDVDGVVGGFDLEVAQISSRFGAGLFERITINE